MTTPANKGPSRADRLSYLIKHTDRGARQLAQEQRTIDDTLAEDAKRRRMKREAATEVPMVGLDEIKMVIDLVANLTGRPVAIERLGRERHFSAIQRCRACRAEVVVRVPGFAQGEPQWQATLGHAVRHAYARHLCEPLDRALHGCSVEELDTIIAETEREIERVCGRFKDIEGELAAREAARQEAANV